MFRTFSCPMVVVVWWWKWSLAWRLQVNFFFHCHTPSSWRSIFSKVFDVCCYAALPSEASGFSQRKVASSTLCHPPFSDRLWTVLWIMRKFRPFSSGWTRQSRSRLCFGPSSPCRPIEAEEQLDSGFQPMPVLQHTEWYQEARRVYCLSLQSSRS